MEVKKECLRWETLLFRWRILMAVGMMLPEIQHPDVGIVLL